MTPPFLADERESAAWLMAQAVRELAICTAALSERHARLALATSPAESFRHALRAARAADELHDATERAAHAASWMIGLGLEARAREIQEGFPGLARAANARSRARLEARTGPALAN